MNRKEFLRLYAGIVAGLGIKRQLDAVIESQAAQFAPLPEESADKRLVKRTEDRRSGIRVALAGRGHAHLSWHAVRLKCTVATYLLACQTFTSIRGRVDARCAYHVDSGI